jgi:tRNA (guanosine-2'-O-)-methyltransferase
MMPKQKSNLRIKADKAKSFRCKDLIAVLENPKDFSNIGSVIRNIDALGVSKLYVVDQKNLLPKDWQEMRTRKSLNDISCSAVKWAFVKTFDSTKDCLEYLKKKEFTSFVTSPHIKGKTNIDLTEGKFTQKRLAVWFGNESRGISEEAVEGSSGCIQIPMGGIIESFNLATSTGIVLYEITKQRRKYTQQLLKKKQQHNEKN